MTHNEDDELQERLGYRFRNPELLIRALTHSSAIPELRAAAEASSGSSSEMQDNERLEFLGDAVLDLLEANIWWESFQTGVKVSCRAAGRTW